MNTRQSVAALRSEVERFEIVAQAAADEAVSGLAGLDTERFEAWTSGPMPRGETAYRIDLLQFLDHCLESDHCPNDRLDDVMDRAIDFKCQVMILTDLASGNGDYEWLAHKLKEEERRPNWWRLRHYSRWQHQVVAVRIAWERLTQLVYTLETGGPRPRHQRIEDFTTWLADHPHWRWLEPFGPELIRFDEVLRNPEVHRLSKARASILGDEKLPVDELLLLLNYLCNIWHSIDSVVAHGAPTHFTDVHIGEDNEVNPRYLGSIPQAAPPDNQPRV